MRIKDKRFYYALPQSASMDIISIDPVTQTYTNHTKPRHDNELIPIPVGALVAEPSEIATIVRINGVEQSNAINVEILNSDLETTSTFFAYGGLKAGDVIEFIVA